MEGSKVKCLAEELQKSSRVIVNQLNEYVRQNETCTCSCHGTSQELEDKEANIAIIETKVKESQDMIKRFMDRDKENKLKLTSLLEENDRLKSSLDDLTKTFNKNAEKLFAATREEQRVQAADLPNENSSQGNTGNRLVLRNPTMQVQRIQQDTRPIPSGTVIHPNVSFHRERLKEREKAPRMATHWDWSMTIELEKAKARANRLEDGIQTVICLDTSSSMLENNAWEQACVFLTDYINGLEREATNRDTHKEYVAVVTFGTNTTVLQHMTNDYGTLWEVLNSVEIGGPSPLFHGLNMTSAPWTERDTHNNIRHYDVEGMIDVHPKVILITDCQPTDTFLSQGPDTFYRDSEAGVKSVVLDKIEALKISFIDFFVVQVGQEKTGFLDVLVTFADGIKLTHNDGHKMARRSALTIQAAKERRDEEQNPWFHLFMSGRDASEEEKREKKEIMDRADEKLERQMESISREIHREREDTSLPAVGTRVRRGPDWPPADTDDGFGPGTIVGHNLSELKVVVGWDVTKLNAYRYGADGFYDLTIVDEYRELSILHIMAVGCKVHPGRDWSSGETDRRLTGVAIRCAKRNKVDMTWVKWNNGTSGWYSPKNPEEVVLCGRQGRCMICEDRGSIEVQGAKTDSRPNKNKNVNKNVNKNMTKQ